MRLVTPEGGEIIERLERFRLPLQLKLLSVEKPMHITTGFVQHAEIGLEPHYSRCE